MQNENMTLQIIAGEKGAPAEIIIREVNSVNELPVLKPIQIHVTGTIGAPFEYLEKKLKAEKIDLHVCRLIVNKDGGVIVLIMNETDQYTNGSVTGSIQDHPKMKSFGINTGKEWEPNQLGQFLKMNRAFFKDKNENMQLVSLLKNFDATINSQIVKTKNEKGDFADNFSGVVARQFAG